MGAQRLKCLRGSAGQVATELLADSRTRPQWDDLVGREPRLASLLSEAVRAGGHGYQEPAWAHLKAALRRLVGWGAVDPMLSSSEAYDVAYRTVLLAFERGGEDDY